MWNIAVGIGLIPVRRNHRGWIVRRRIIPVIIVGQAVEPAGRPAQRTEGYVRKSRRNGRSGHKQYRQQCLLQATVLYIHSANVARLEMKVAAFLSAATEFYPVKSGGWPDLALHPLLDVGDAGQNRALEIHVTRQAPDHGSGFIFPGVAAGNEHELFTAA